MRSEHVKLWLPAARKAGSTGTWLGGEEATTTTAEGRPEATAAQEGLKDWTRVVDLVQAAFREGKLAEDATWQAVVLIPKGKKDYRGIGLVEVSHSLTCSDRILDAPLERLLHSDIA